MKKSPLTGCKVLDLGRYIAGPFCAMLLGDMGADVIKVEQTNGDDGRRMKPAIGDLSTYFMISNRNKRSITLNFKQPKGKENLTKTHTTGRCSCREFPSGSPGTIGSGLSIPA